MIRRAAIPDLAASDGRSRPPFAIAEALAYTRPMSTISDKARATHATGSNCAQSVLCAFSDSVAFDAVAAHRFATGLGAGFGRRQLVCGAVSGGAMAIGAALGNDTGADAEAKERCYALVDEFVGKIEAEFGSSSCQALLGVDLKTPEGRAAVKDRGLNVSVCERIIGRAAELAAEIIAQANRAR